jgi:hypothetical protein
MKKKKKKKRVLPISFLLKNIKMFIIITILLLLLLATSIEAWTFLGPGNVQEQNTPFVSAPTDRYASAANDVVKVGGDTWLLATTNGGVFRTTSSTNDKNPNWVNVWDNQPVTCSSMTKFHVSKINPNKVYASCGASSSAVVGFSSMLRMAGDMAGFAVSTDKGENWKMAAFPPNYSIEDILELPNGDVAIAVVGGFFNDSDGGVWISSNIFDRNSWTKTHDVPTFHFAFDNTTNTIFTSSSAVEAARAVFSSTDFGKTWTP